jgi:hypothetical protein
VIGNPPYVQLQKLKKNPLQELYKKASYQTYDSSGDLYCLFYEHAVNMLKSNGHLSYITSNKWMRANYGHRLRNFFIKYNPLRLIDLGPAVFESATVDTNILFLQKKPNTSISLSATQYKKSDLPLIDFINQNSIILNKPNAEAWFIGNDAEYKLKQKIEKLGKPLRNWNIRIQRGLLTGLNEAFIIDTATKEALCKEDSKSIEIIRPLLKGKNISKYSYTWTDNWLINTGFDLDIPKLFPAVYNHLLKFQAKAVIRDDQGANWWNLRACSYYDDFDKEKIIWSDIAKEPSFVLLNKNLYFNNTVYMILGDQIKYLTAILNSRFNKWYFPLIASGLGDKSCRYFKVFVEAIPIPSINKVNQSTIKNIETLVDKILSRTEKEGYHEDKKLQSEVHELESEIDKLIYKLYELNPEEISLIEEASKDS